MPVDLMFFVEEVEPIDQLVRDFAAVANLGFFGIGEPLYLYHRLLAQGLGGWEEAAAGLFRVCAIRALDLTVPLRAQGIHRFAAATRYIVHMRFSSPSRTPKASARSLHKFCLKKKV